MPRAPRTVNTLSNVSDTVERALRLLALLQDRSVWGGKDLARRMGVSTRTVRSDIRRLRGLGYQVEGTPGGAGGYRLLPGAVVPPLLFDDDEAVAVLTGLRLLAGTSLGGMDDAAEEAMGKVLRLLPVRLRERAQAVAMFIDADGGLDGDASPDLVRDLDSACRAGTRLRFAYRARGLAAFHDVEPYRVVSVRRRWYLLAWDASDRDWRIFRLDGIGLLDSQARSRFEPRPLPSEDPVAWVLSRVEKTPWPYQAELLVDAPAEDLSARLPPNAVIEPDGARTSRVRLSADSPALLAPWLGLLDAGFRLADPDRDRELARCIDVVRERYTAALGTGGGR